MDYAKIDGRDNIPHMKGNVKAYLGVLIEWLQSLYKSRHGQAASQETQSKEIAEASDRFDATSSGATNIESTVHKEVSLYQNDYFTDMRDHRVLRWISESKDNISHVTTLARCVFSPPASQIDNEKVFSAPGVISQNRWNRIWIRKLDSGMHIYHK